MEPRPWSSSDNHDDDDEYWLEVEFKAEMARRIAELENPTPYERSPIHWRQGEHNLPEPDAYVDLNHALSAAIDLHGARAKRRHVGQATMKAIGYTPTSETSMHTLLVFAWLAAEIDYLLGLRVIPIDGKARALADLVVRAGQVDLLDTDLGQPALPHHRSSFKWRQIDIEQDLFVHIRRFLRRLEENGALVDHAD
jgi:hypothetical protein